LGGVVTVRTLLSTEFPKPSRAMTLNSCVDDGKRWKAVENVYATESQTTLPSSSTRYETSVTLSTDLVHVMCTHVGTVIAALTVGAGLGAVVSGGVVKVTALLLAERVPMASIA
jgi:hypothetical protein